MRFIKTNTFCTSWKAAHLQWHLLKGPSLPEFPRYWPINTNKRCYPSKTHTFRIIYIVRSVVGAHGFVTHVRLSEGEEWWRGWRTRVDTHHGECKLMKLNEKYSYTVKNILNFNILLIYSCFIFHLCIWNLRKCSENIYFEIRVYINNITLRVWNKNHIHVYSIYWYIF